MANSYLGRCEQDLVGFNFLNSGYPLRIGVPTIVGNALVIDTNASPGYTGTVQLSIANQLGMTAVFQETGTTYLTKTVGPNTLTWIPLIVTADDCGYDRGYYWEFRVWYTSSPDYSANTGGEDPDPCGKPLRSVKVCRWDARWDNKCLAGFATDLTEVTGTGVVTLPFLLNQSPQCTGPVKVTFSTECEGLSFSAEQPGVVPPDVTCDPIIRREPEVVLGNGNINSPIYIDYLNEVWVSDSVNDEIQRFDASTYAILTPIALTPGDAPVGLFYFGGGLDKVYVALGGANDVAIIDTNTLVVTSITGAIGTAPSRFTWVTEPGVSEAWVTCIGSDNVYRIDVMTDTVVGGAIAVQVQPNDILFTGNGKVYVASQSASMYVIDTTTYGAGAVSGAPSVFRMALSGSVIYARANGTVYKVNSNTSTLISSFSVGGDGGLAHMPGNGFFIIDKNTDSMFLYNEDTAPVLLNTYTTGQTPSELIIEPTVGRLFVTNTAVGDVTPYTTRACANPIFNLVTSQILEVTLESSYASSSFDINVDYDTSNINCYCEIKAVITYENSLPNTNLLTFGNNGTFAGLTTQAQFNTAGVLARSATTFGFTTGISGTALRTTITTPPDYTNRPIPASPVNPSASDGSIIWQGDITTPVALTNTTRYWLRGKVRIDSGTPLIRANEEVHIDKFHVGGSGPSQNVAVPYLSQYTPQSQYLDCGIRFLSGSSSTITPYVRYVNTLAIGPYTTLMGDLYLGDSAYSDWCDIQLTRYYPSDAIECPDKTHVFKNSSCEYNTYLGLDEETPCEKIDFIDNSDFGYEPGHDRSDFTVFRRITAMGPDGTNTILASIPPRNIDIPPAASDTAPPLIYAGYDISQGGFYEFTLCNVPTFRNDIAYPLGTNVVFYDGVGNLVFLECINPVAGYTPFLTTGWQWVWKPVTEAELNEKYCDTQYYIQLCGLVRCISEYQNKLICSMDYICSVSLCENECVMNYFELMMIKQVSDYTAPETDEKCWGTQEYRDILNYVNQLCETCECK